MSFKDFAKRVDNGEVKDGTQLQEPTITLEDIEDGINRRCIKQFEREEKEKKHLEGVIGSGVIIAIVCSLMTGMIVESIVFAVVISFIFGLVSEKYN